MKPSSTWPTMSRPPGNAAESVLNAGTHNLALAEVVFDEVGNNAARGQFARGARFEPRAAIDDPPGQHPVGGADRVVLQEHSRFGVDECGGVAMGDGDALRLAGRPGGEDDPRVVAGLRGARLPSA